MTHENRLPRQSPESQGIPSSAVLSFVDTVQKQIDELHSFMLLRHGAVLAEGWWSPHSPDRPHMLFSLSKSFTSSAIGLAVSEKLLSIEAPVLSFFPDDAPSHISKNLAAMQVRHLLSMSTGHATDTMGPLFKRRDGNWPKAFLALPVKYKPGTHFLYNTGATYMLSAILQKVSGKTLLDYLKPRLLDPLGIKNATWEMSPQGVCMGGFGMSIKTEDIACFGQMYLQKGMWNGKRILPEAWIEEATSFQIDNKGNNTNENSDWQQGYGYQFWRCQHGAYRGDGAFGQYCVVMPEQDAVLAITSGVGNMQSVLDLVWEHLLPVMGKTASLPAHNADHEKLQHKLESLAYLPPKGKATSSKAAKISGNTYALKPNSLKIKTISFDFSEPGCTVTIRSTQGKDVIKCGSNAWHENMVNLFGQYPHLVASATWSAEDTLVLTFRLYETPFVHTFTCHFTEDGLEIDGKVNVSFGLTAYALSGQLQK